MSTNSADENGNPRTSPAADGKLSAQIDPLADTLNGSRRVAPAVARRGVVPQIEWREERRGTLPGNKYVRVLRAQDQVFRQVTPDYLVAGEQLSKPRSPLGKLHRALVGRPIP